MSSKRRHLLVAAAAGAAGAIGLLGARHPVASSIVELVVVVSGLIAIGAAPSVATRVREMSPRHRTISIAILSLMVIGHWVGRSRDTFPFLRWDMYGEPAVEAGSDVESFELHGVTADGANVPIRLSGIFGRVGWRVQSSLRRPGSRVLRNAADGAACADLDAWLLAAAARYDHLHSHAPLRAIECRAVRFRPGERGEGAPADARLVRRIELRGRR